jgi:hypothetical protein
MCVVLSPSAAAEGSSVASSETSASSSATTAAEATSTTTTAAAIASHLSQTRINLLFGLGQHAYEIASLLGICEVVSQLSSDIAVVTYCQW